jgi:hypothetical protein
LIPFLEISMSNPVPNRVQYKGATYVLAEVEVAYDALNDEARFLVDLWLSKSSTKPGTPEYEEAKKQFIKKALQFGEHDPMSGDVVYAEKAPDVTSLKSDHMAQGVKAILATAGITVEQLCTLADNLKFLCEAEKAAEEADDE